MDVPDRPDREDLLGQLIRVDAERDHDGQHDCRRDLAEKRAEKGSEHASEIASCRKPDTGTATAKAPRKRARYSAGYQ